MKHPEVSSLYKYRKLNERTLEIISDGRIYFPKPEAFNDPFDTKCTFNKNKIITQEFDSKKIERAFPGETMDSISAFRRKDVSAQIEQFKYELKNIGILSLAENRRNLLMWAHYADEHKGICIELERSPKNGLGADDLTSKVNYSAKYPSLRPESLLDNQDRKSALKRVLFTKSKEWEYEGEWRSFKECGGTAYSLPGKIKSITFGARASDESIREVKQILESRNVRLYRAELKANEFGIKFSKVI